MDFLLHSYIYLRTSMSLLRDNLRGDERGALTAEYVGILVVIGAIIAALIAAGIPGRIRTEAQNALNAIFGGGAPAPGRSPGPQPT